MQDTGDLRRDALSGAILLLFGGGYLWYALRYPLGTLDNPGPGVFPLAVGLPLVILAAVQLARSGGRLLMALPTPTADPSVTDPTGTPLKRGRTEGALWLMVGVLVLYLLVVSAVGFLASTFVLVIICSKVMRTCGWVRPIFLAVGVLLACYFLFLVWLKVPLPAGSLL
jgi:hypothetical protein